MPKFSFTAVDANGRESQSIIEAPSQSQAISRIRAQNLFPTKIAMVQSGGNDPFANTAMVAVPMTVVPDQREYGVELAF